MMTTLATEIKYVEYSFETLNEIELCLDSILVEELEKGLANDLDNPF